MDRLDKISVGLDEGKGTAGKLLTDTALVVEAQNLLARANDGMSELRGVVTNLDTAMKSVQIGTARLPEITDAVAKEAKDLMDAGVGRAELVPMAIGLVVSAVVGYMVIAWLLEWVRRRDLTVFVVYRLILAAVIFAALYFR